MAEEETEVVVAEDLAVEVAVEEDLEIEEAVEDLGTEEAVEEAVEEEDLEIEEEQEVDLVVVEDLVEAVEEVVEDEVAWVVERRFLLNLIVMLVCSLPEEKRMLLSLEIWLLEILFMVKKELLLRMKVRLIHLPLLLFLQFL